VHSLVLLVYSSVVTNKCIVDSYIECTLENFMAMCV
jgi:hypothetical protein